VVYQDDEDPLERAVKAIGDVVGAQAKVGVELGSWTMPAQRAQRLMAGCEGLDWQDATGVVDRLRLVKSTAELAILRDASTMTARMADKAVAATSAGKTENDLTQVVMAEMISSGSEYPGSWPNIMAGPRTGLIHAAWEGGLIETNDHVLTEITGVKHRYHAPCLRSIFVGPPRPEI
jgi:Xaa-Pro dipeptidase